MISGPIGSAWFDGQPRCHKWFWLRLLGCWRSGIEIQRQIRNNKQIQKSIFNLGFLVQVTVTADGLQARYVDKTKLDLPAITASSRYRWRICLEAFFVLFPYRSYLNIAQYEEVDSDDESVANKFTRWVKSQILMRWNHDYIIYLESYTSHGSNGVLMSLIGSSGEESKF